LSGNIEWIVLDVDGTLTNGIIHYDSAGNEHKQFHVADGLGIVMAQAAGLKVAVISGRSSPIVERRMNELGVTELVQASGNKAAALQDLMTRHRLTSGQVAYIGDDLNDLPAFRLAGFKVAVADGAQKVRAQADFVTQRSGGHGAVREAIEEVLSRQGKLEEAVAAYLMQSAAKDAPRQ
jgi:3-deoxy-D-manno-octulosonate 8-phosphate phosphatase (KDO 8-P phosphatase)